jgi:hypothetical protein
MYHLTVSQYGLVSDIIGVILLFKYGFPSKIKSPLGVRIVGEISDEESKRVNKSNRRVKFWGYTGLGLIIIGFVLQFIGGFK